MNRARFVPRSVMLIIVIGLIVLLILSYSRSRWIAALVGLAVLPSMRRHAWRWGLILLLVAIPFSGRLATRLSDVPTSFDLLRTVGAREVTLGRGESQSSIEWRLLNALVLTRIGLQSPWIGHGARTTEQVTPLRLLDESGQLAGYASHNDVVEAFVEYGLIGLLSLVGTIALIWSGIRAAMQKLSPSSPEHALGTGLLSAGAALVVAGVTGDTSSSRRRFSMGSGSWRAWSCARVSRRRSSDGHEAAHHSTRDLRDDGRFGRCGGARGR